MIVGHFERVYEYFEDEDVTVAHLGGIDVNIDIEPAFDSDVYDHYVTVRGKDGEKGIRLRFSSGGLSDLIADLQRELHGAFARQFPRSVVSRGPVVRQENHFHVAAPDFDEKFTARKPDPELERLLAEEAEIEARCAERAEELRQEDEMQADARERGEISGPSEPTARELVEWIKKNLHPEQHVAIDVERVNEESIAYLHAVD